MLDPECKEKAFQGGSENRPKTQMVGDLTSSHTTFDRESVELGEGA